MLLKIILLAVVLNFQYVNGANILGIMSIPSPSHSLWNTVLINELAEKGHNLTVLTADLPRNSKDFRKNVQYINMHDVYKTFEYDGDIKDFINMSGMQSVIGYAMYSIEICKASVKVKEFIEFMDKYKDEKFDLILYDYTFGPCLLGLVHNYNYPPVVSVSAFPYAPIVTKFIGGHFYPSYISYYSAVLDVTNNFFDRMLNHIYYIAEELLRIYVMVPKMDEAVRSIFPKETPYLGDLEKLSTIALIGTHPAITDAQALPQNVIEVGGLNLIKPEPLPKHLEDFINASKKGAVFFSLGTNIQPKTVGSKLAEELLNTMEKFPEYNFLWKFDVNFITRKIPKNVLIEPFFPQRDILAHSKTKCFITHAGGLSTQESIWYGVPMITIPVFVDQIRNSYVAVKKGFSVEVNYMDLNEKSFYNALNRVLNDPKYYNNIKLQSERFRDRPMKPVDSAIWWIEYVLRHPHPDHLKVPTLEMGFFAANSYDFVFLVLAVMFLIVYVNVRFIKYLLSFRRNKKSQEKKVKKN